MTITDDGGRALVRWPDPAGALRAWRELLASAGGDGVCFHRPCPDDIIGAQVAPCQGTALARGTGDANASRLGPFAASSHLFELGASTTPPEHRALRLAGRSAVCLKCLRKHRLRLEHGDLAMGVLSYSRPPQPGLCDRGIAVLHRQRRVRELEHLSATTHRRLSPGVFGTEHVGVRSNRHGALVTAGGTP